VSERLALLATPELMMQSRLRESLEGLGFGVLIGDGAEAIASGLKRRPSVLILDLQATSDSAVLISRSRDASIPVLAYGQHTKPNVLREAREAGASLAVTRSQLVEELPSLVDEVLERGMRPAAHRP
jgi:DNA-binding NarL/FixJ family response regulator